MPVVLGYEQIGPYLDGALNEFGPSGVALMYAETENFLKKKKDPEPPAQPDLF